MATLTNTPTPLVTIRAERNKALAFRVRMRYSNKRKVDLRGSSLLFRLAKVTPTGLEDIVDKAGFGSDDDREHGQMMFNFQAPELNLPEGEYDFSIMLRTGSLFTMLVVKGVFIIEPNVAWPPHANDASYPPVVDPVQGIEAVVRLQQVIQVTAPPMLPLRAGYLSDEDKARLDWLWSNRGEIPPGITATIALDDDYVPFLGWHSPTHWIAWDLDDSAPYFTPEQTNWTVLYDTDGVPYILEGE